MRKLIIAATALAFIASPALAQDKGAAPAAGATDTGSDTMKKAPKAKKAKKSSAKKSGDDAMTKQ